ncbi:MAG: hypothetical protein KA248_02290 [Kiritimatiellae bacterium]|nr:hypothetical protein [Kiritimatiellia bacterium]
MDTNIKRVLDFLNRNRLRATYRDVAGFLRVPTPSLAVLLGPPRPAASWVVNSETGKPSGYAETDCHPDLRAHDIIADEQDLRLKMKLEKIPGRQSRAHRRDHRSAP